MAKEKRLSKEEQEQAVSRAQARKERDIARGVRWTPCGNPDCKEVVEWLLPKHVEATEANIEKYKPVCCGTEKCSKIIQAQKVAALKQKSS